MVDLQNLELLGNGWHPWLKALGVATAVVLAARVVKALAVSQLRRLSDRTETSIDDVLVSILDATNWLCVTVVALWAGSQLLTLSDGAEKVIAVAAQLAIVVQVGLFLLRGVGDAIARWVRREQEDEENGNRGRATTAKLLLLLSKIAIWSIVLLMSMANVGIEISALLAGLGVGGIAAALAVQNVLGDLLASLSIYFDRPFDIGDFVVIGEFSGTIEKVGWRSTRIKSISGEQVIFANSDLAKARVRNFRRMEERRIVFSVGVEYNLPLALVKRIPNMLRESVEAVDGVRFDRAHFKSYGDFALLFEIVYFVEAPDFGAYMDAQQAINLGIYERFEAAGVPFALPTQTLHVAQQGGWTMDLPRPDERRANGHSRAEAPS